MRARVSAAAPLLLVCRMGLWDTRTAPASLLSASSPSLTTPRRPFCAAPRCLLSPSSSFEGKATRPRCPECGKYFPHEGILREHRRRRHFVDLPTLEQEVLAATEGEMESLRTQLAAVRARLEALREGLANQEETPERKLARTRPQPNELDGAEDVPYSAATVHGRLLTNVPQSILHRWETRSGGRAVGTNLSVWTGVGTVVHGTVCFGTLEGFQQPADAQPAHQQPDTTLAAPSPPATMAVPRVLQFQLETTGYRDRRLWKLKMFRNRVLVRHIFPPGTTCGELFTVREGDFLRVQGHYAQHKTFDAVSKSFVENPVVEADEIGLLQRGEGKKQESGLSSTATPPTPSSRGWPVSSQRSSVVVAAEAKAESAGGVVPAKKTAKRNLSKKSKTKRRKKKLRIAGK